LLYNYIILSDLLYKFAIILSMEL